MPLLASKKDHILTLTLSRPSMRNAWDDDYNEGLVAELNKATADKGGHRNKALGLVNQALAEVTAGITFDRIDPRNRRRNDDGDASAIFNEFSSNSKDQPHMQRAKDHLQSALDNLQKATADKGGHRQKAIDLVKDAIEQCNKGIAFDRNN